MDPVVHDDQHTAAPGFRVSGDSDAVVQVEGAVSADSRFTGALLAFTGLLHLVSLGRWAGDRTWRERLLLILHVGYAFVPLGFLLNAASAFGLVQPGAGIHAWMAGAAGIMTLAVMSRATLGHTGRRLTASATTQAIYAAIIVAALARICAALEPAHYGPLLHLAAFAWVAAFLGFSISFGRLLTSRS